MTLKSLVQTLLLSVCALAGLARAGEPVYAVPDADRARSDLAVLIVPVTLDIEMIDGIVPKGTRSLFRKGDTQVYLLPGEREVALRYNEFFQTTHDSHDIVKSKIIVATFVAAPGKVYRATHPEFRNAAKARAGAENLKLEIVDDRGSNRIVAAGQSQKSWHGEETFTSRKDLVSAQAVAERGAALPATAAAPAGSAASAGTEAAGAAPAAPVNTAPVSAAPAGGLNAVDLLKFTWQNATAADRAAFLEWVKANP